MESQNYLIACGIMSASGFTLAYYRYLAFNQMQKAPEKAKRIYDTFTPRAIAYIKELEDKWKIAPVIFNSDYSFFTGWLIVIIGFVFNLFKNRAHHARMEHRSNQRKIVLFAPFSFHKL